MQSGLGCNVRAQKERAQKKAEAGGGRHCNWKRTCSTCNSQSRWPQCDTAMLNAESCAKSVEKSCPSIFVRIRALTQKLTNSSEESRLDIIVKPSQVRLNPNANNPYKWKFLSEKKELFSSIFSKNISNHSISAYRELCEGVRVTFKAVSVISRVRNTPNSLTTIGKRDSLQAKYLTNKQLCPNISFSIKID